MRFLETIKAIANFPITDQANMDAVNMKLMAQKVLDLYEVERAKPIDTFDSFDVIGIKDDDTSRNLGTFAISPESKAKDIVRSYFGDIDEENFDDGAMALQCCVEVLNYIKKYECHFFDGHNIKGE